MTLIGAVCIAVGGMGLLGIALYGVIRLWEDWHDMEYRPQHLRHEEREPRRIGKVFPDEGDIDIALEIVNGKENLT